MNKDIKKIVKETEQLPLGKTLLKYLANGQSTGGFLKALLSNDLFTTYARMDEQNEKLLNKYIKTIYSRFPSRCWGNEEKYKQWIKQGGLQRDKFYPSFCEIVKEKYKGEK